MFVAAVGCERLCEEARPTLAPSSSPPPPRCNTTTPAGNEGYGLRTNVRRACTSLVRIEMGAVAPRSKRGAGGGGGAAVDSLNVSVAAGILLHHLIATRPQG